MNTLGLNLEYKRNTPLSILRLIVENFDVNLNTKLSAGYYFILTVKVDFDKTAIYMLMRS